MSAQKDFWIISRLLVSAGLILRGMLLGLGEAVDETHSTPYHIMTRTITDTTDCRWRALSELIRTCLRVCIGWVDEFFTFSGNLRGMFYIRCVIVTTAGFALCDIQCAGKFPTRLYIAQKSCRCAPRSSAFRCAFTYTCGLLLDH